MHSVAAAGTAVLYTEGLALPSLVSGGSVGVSLFFGEPIVEDLSKKVAGTLFSKESAYYVVAEIVADIALRSFAAFAMANLSLSVLAGSLIMPLPVGGALMAGAMSQSFDRMMEITLSGKKTEPPRDPTDIMWMAGEQIGTITEDGHHAVVEHPRYGQLRAEVLSCIGDKFPRPVTTDSRDLRAKVQYSSGSQHVIISKGFVYEMNCSK